MPKPNYIHVINFIKGMQHMTGKDKVYHIFRRSYSPRTKSFKASLEYLQRFYLLEYSSHCIVLIQPVNTFIKSKCFHVQCYVSGTDRAIRDPIKPELWDLLFALQSSPNCPKTAGNTCLLYRSFSSTAYWGNTHLSYKTQMFTETDRSYI